MSKAESFYIVKRPTGTCDIVSDPPVKAEDNDSRTLQTWGPFSSAQDAIARRVGLIRAGKCKPV